MPTAVVSLHEFCFTAGTTPVERRWRRRSLAHSLTRSPSARSSQQNRGSATIKKPTSAENQTKLKFWPRRPPAFTWDTRGLRRRALTRSAAPLCLWKCKSNLSCRQTTVSQKDRRKSESEREGGRGREITFDL